MPKSMRVRVRYHRQPKHGCQTPLGYSLHGPFGGNPVPEEIPAVLADAAGQGNAIESVLQLAWDRKKHGFSILLRPQEDPPSSRVLRDSLTTEQSHITDAQRGISFSRSCRIIQWMLVTERSGH
jgi:hypothetical protein